jgi:hypothetical protein
MLFLIGSRKGAKEAKAQSQSDIFAPLPPLREIFLNTFAENTSYLKRQFPVSWQGIAIWMG